MSVDRSLIRVQRNAYAVCMCYVFVEVDLETFLMFVHNCRSWRAAILLSGCAVNVLYCLPPVASCEI